MFFHGWKVLCFGCFLVLATTQAFALDINPRDIEKFCKQEDRAYPEQEGVQFDGEAAHPWVMSLKEGKYNVESKVDGTKHTTTVLILDDDYYLVVLPDIERTTHGSDGDDMIYGKNVLAGCSKEQLSEVLRKNKILDDGSDDGSDDDGDESTKTE